MTRIHLPLLASIFLLTGCQTRPPRANAPPPPTSPAPRGGAAAPANAPAAPPAPATTSHRVAVILGPGGAKSWAHVGVLRALQRQRVPIDRVIGLEWGALVGGLFAHRGQIHDLEWKLYKMNQQNLPRPPAKGLFGRGAGGASGVGVMTSFLGESFGGDDVNGAKVPFACPARSLWTGVVNWQTRGAFRDVMKRCLAFPPVFSVEGSAIAGASQVAESVELARREGYDVIVLVNVLGSALPSKQDGLPENASHVILWQEIKREIARVSASGDVESLEVNTNQYPMLQFDANKELVQLGETAGAAAAARLIRKYGF